MAVNPPASPLGKEKPVEEQRVYATLLRAGSHVSIGVLVLTFLLYISGLTTPRIPIDRLPQYWGLRAQDYLRLANLPNGWGWVRLIAFGDFLNFTGIVMLAGITIVCYLVILPIFLRKQDTPYILIVLAEIAILLLAASGLLAAGH